jgi:hypothetical protein
MKKIDEKQKRSLSILTRIYYTYQNERIRISNQLGVKKDGNKKKKTPDRDDDMLIFMTDRLESISKMEMEIEKEIMSKIKNHKLWTIFLQNIKGVGPIMAAVIITEFDIHKAPAVSNMWSFAGLAPGKDKKTKGNKCPYNQFLRSKLCGVLGGSFLKSKSMPYSAYYYDTKTRLESSNKKIIEYLRYEDRKKKKYKGQKEREVEWKNAYSGHRHKAAVRKMIKMFLIDVYVAWRTIEGLSIRKPYSVEYLDKKHNSAKSEELII